MTQPSITERVYAAKSNSAEADGLIRDYLPFIRSETSKIVGRAVREGVDDEMSIAMMAFHEAVGSYHKMRGAFLHYASVAMRRRLIDYYRREKRHSGQISIDAPTGQEETALADVLPDSSDDYRQMDMRDAARQEIAELTAQLRDFGLSLTDIADNCPKQERTLGSCQKALAYARENTRIIDELKRTKRLPLAVMVKGCGVERKTLERHRKYLMALLLIYSNGYEIIRGHLKQVLKPQQRRIAT